MADLSTEQLLRIVAENTGKRINLNLEDLDLYLAVAREAIRQATPAQGDELLPLPEKIGTIYPGNYWQGSDKDRPNVQAIADVVTMGQCREYGAACRASKQGGEDARDAARLDFMAAEECCFETMLADGKVPFYRLYCQHSGEAQSEWFKCPREAIDAARTSQPGGAAERKEN